MKNESPAQYCETELRSFMYKKFEFFQKSNKFCDTLLLVVTYLCRRLIFCHIIMLQTLLRGQE